MYLRIAVDNIAIQMIQELQLRILPEQAANEQSIKQYVAREKGLDVRTIQAVRTLKRSIDARQRTIFFHR